MLFVSVHQDGFVASLRELVLKAVSVLIHIYTHWLLILETIEYTGETYLN